MLQSVTMAHRTLKLYLLLTVLGASSPLVHAGSILYSDLGTGSNLYSTRPMGSFGYGFSICGSAGPGCGGYSWINADLFMVSGTGNLPVTQVDLAVWNANSSLNTFTASIWTDNGGLPGIQVSNAFWSTSTPYAFDSCCGLVSIQNISGLTLTGGTQYFLVLAPVSLTDSSFNAIALNSIGATGVVLVSENGGSSWISDYSGPATAFDILSTPEPATSILIGFGLAALLLLLRVRQSGATDI